MDQLKNINELYPRLIKHHSEQLSIKSTLRNGITINTLVPAYVVNANIENFKGVERLQHVQNQEEKLQRHINIL